MTKLPSPNPTVSQKTLKYLFLKYELLNHSLSLKSKASSKHSSYLRDFLKNINVKVSQLVISLLWRSLTSL